MSVICQFIEDQTRQQKTSNENVKKQTKKLSKLASTPKIIFLKNGNENNKHLLAETTPKYCKNY